MDLADEVSRRVRHLTLGKETDCEIHMDLIYLKISQNGDIVKIAVNWVRLQIVFVKSVLESTV